MSGPAILELQGIGLSFGGVRALDAVDGQAGADEILGLIGPNGAGKTTLFNVISGLIRPHQGTINFRGRNCTNLPPHLIARQGIARTFQNVRVFPEMTALENVMLGRHVKTKAGLLSALFKPPWEWREERRTRETAMELLEETGLADRAHEHAGNLPFGRMRMLEIARALASEPKLILLDEPAAGLNHSETDRLAETILGIRKRGIAIVVVEHDMRLVMEISDRVMVLNEGRKIADGKPREVQNHPEVIEAYLGEQVSPSPDSEAGGAATGEQA